MLRILMAAFAALCIVNVASAAEDVHHSNLHKFEAFPADTKSVKKASLKLERGTFSWSFRTRIREAYEGQPNFAGYYIVVQWGCGTECQMGAIINLKTGKVTEIPHSTLGIDYRADSRLFMVNPFWDEYRVNPEWYVSDPTTYYYHWNGQEFTLLTEEKWLYPEQEPSAELDLVVPIPTSRPESATAAWKAIAYTEDGDFVTAAGESETKAALAAFASCSQNYNHCEKGVSVPSDWEIAVGTCHNARYVQVSLGRSPDGKHFEADRRMLEMNSLEIASCK